MPTSIVAESDLKDCILGSAGLSAQGTLTSASAVQHWGWGVGVGGRCLHVEMAGEAEWGGVGVGGGGLDFEMAGRTAE